jgi:hypothetical protein
VDNDELIKYVAALAQGYQTVEARSCAIEGLLKDSIIIPGNKVNNILLTVAVVFAVAVMGFCFMFYQIRPL